MQESTDKKKQWSYKESFFFLGGLVLLGFIIEFISGGAGFSSPPFPYNVTILCELVVLIPLAFFMYSTSPLIRWLSSIPAAIAAIIMLTILVLLIGFIPADSMAPAGIMHRLGFTHLFHSWAYLFASLQLIIILGFTVMKRLTPVSWRNFAFFLNHFGLWIVLVAASLGTGDMKTMMMYCRIGHTTTDAYNEQMESYRMPFALQLQKFTIEEYNPTLVLVDNKTEKILKNKNNDDFVLGKGKHYNLKNWRIEADTYLPYSFRNDSGFSERDTVGAVPSAYVVINDSLRGWISSGNAFNKPAYLRLNNEYTLAMTLPQPKLFRSDLLLSDTETKQSIVLEVNKPFSYKGWELYQSGYDNEKGKWSQISIIQAVRDPWLPVVFGGIYILLAGAVMMFWLGNRKREEAR